MLKSGFKNIEPTLKHPGSESYNQLPKKVDTKNVFLFSSIFSGVFGLLLLIIINEIMYLMSST